MYALMVLVFLLSLWTLYYTSDHDQMVFDPLTDLQHQNLRLIWIFGPHLNGLTAFTQKMTSSQL